MALRRMHADTNFSQNPYPAAILQIPTFSLQTFTHKDDTFPKGGLSEWERIRFRGHEIESFA